MANNPAQTKRAVLVFPLADVDLSFNVKEWFKNLRPYTLGSFIQKSVAGAVDVTLNVDEAQTVILELTGVLTASINVIVPVAPWQWTVFNNTSGAYTLKVKTPSGTGIFIGQGKRAIIYSNGTNVVRVTPDTSDSSGNQAFQ